jgi:hypothetical protein
VLPALLYLVANAAWVHFIAGFSKYEMIENAAATRVARFSWENIGFYPSCFPAMVGGGTLALALAGVVYPLWRAKPCPGGQFWLCWLFSYSAFQWTFAANEQRYFLFALPALPGFVACLFRPGLSRAARYGLAACLLGLGLIPNTLHLRQLPHGLTGYEAVAERLARLDRPGNVLLACHEDQDLIFRYRACAPAVQRLMLRGDRTLAVRLPDYAAGSQVVPLAHAAGDVLDVLRRGRARYLVTLGPPSRRDDRTEEMVLAHETARALREAFALVETSILDVEYTKPGRRYEVYLWEFLDPLPEGACELPVVIPTANLKIPPQT